MNKHFCHFAALLTSFVHRADFLTAINYHCHPMDYWISGLMDCCKSKSYAKITIWEESEMPILKFFLKSSIYGFS